MKVSPFSYRKTCCGGSRWKNSFLPDQNITDRPMISCVDFLKSVIPYVRPSDERITNQQGILKVKEGVQFCVALHLNHFLLRARDNGDWEKDSITAEEFGALLAEKIDTVKMDYIKADIRRFIKDTKKLDIWSPAYFTS